jgi:hypothetical protein
MKIIAILTLISLCAISIFWYTEVATPYQKEFTQNKAKEVGSAIAEKSKDAGAVVIEKSKEIYEDRDEYLEQAKSIGESISQKVGSALESVKSEAE